METGYQTCYRHPDQQAGVICQRCDRPICPQCMHQASVGFHCPECTKAGAQKVYQGVASLVQRPVVTEVLMGLNVLVFVIGYLVVRSGDYLAGSGTQFHVDYASIAYLRGNVLLGYSGGVGGGEWYRLVTAGFVHFGIIHLAVNMYSLWILGRAAEQYAGRLKFGIIYGVSLLAGSFGSLVMEPQALSAGASGAIFGLMGAMFLAFRAQGIPLSRSPLLSVLILNLLITFSVPNISIGAHLGGLIGGAIAGWAFFDLARRPGIDQRIPYVVCGVLTVAMVVGSIAFASSYTPT
ncbi:rhomboid family intramembrane serine protease [Aquihabitans daechungensis]|uniref:rhomboid family intramembrane serine protease n=1 Tax=Aquihabitans daechungensis TaxID=1052257 RepID=UPI003BA3C5A3